MSRPTFNVIAFRAALDRAREARGLQWKDIAAATGVSQSTLSRMQDGRCPDAASLAALSAWGGIDPTMYREAPPPARWFGAGALNAAIRGLIDAAVSGNGEAYTSNETMMREQLELLERELRSKRSDIRLK